MVGTAPDSLPKLLIGLNKLPNMETLPKLQHILLADDNQINQVVTRKMLEKLGYNCTVATNGREVLDAVFSAPYDLILMDCQMPEMDGFIAAASIRKLENANYGKIPIIALTASAMQQDKDKCLATGMDDYISKPIALATLSQKVSHWLSQEPPSSSSFDNKIASKVSPGSVAPLELTALSVLWSLEKENGGAGIVDQLVDYFKTNAPVYIQKLQAALLEGNPKAVGREAHNLKTSSIFLGAHRMRDCCNKLEALAEKDELTPMASVVSELEFEYKLVLPCLELESQKHQKR
jgi:two-component system sensor histidine kinase/response regulator